MSNIQKVNSGLESLPAVEVRICAALSEMNKLRDFPLDDLEILEWKDTIVKLAPDTTPEMLEFVIDRMITGDIAYEKQNGIRNIFLGLKEIEVKEDGKIKMRSRYRF